jgi:hypothetical protein
VGRVFVFRHCGAWLDGVLRTTELSGIVTRGSNDGVEVGAGIGCGYVPF